VEVISINMSRRKPTLNELVSPKMAAAYDDVETKLTPEEIRETMRYAKDRKWNGPMEDGLNKFWWVYDDCCGLVCAIITVSLHAFAYWAQWKYIFKPWLGLYSLPHFIYTFLAFMAVASHTRCQFTAPGVVPSNAKPPSRLNFSAEDKGVEDEINIYYGQIHRRYTHHRTQTIKPRTSHYCHEVDAVVIKMDHYCPWVNNVVALFTQKYFLLFVFYTCLTCIFCAITLGGRFLSCYRSNARAKYKNWHTSQKMPSWCTPDTTDTIVSICNVIEALIFGIFTIAMGCDQAQAVAENTNYIDRLQKKKGEKQTILRSMEDIWGEPFNWRWFFPLPPTKKLKKDFQKFCKETWVTLAMFEPRVEKAFLHDVQD
jgi:hypothetical protein